MFQAMRIGINRVELDVSGRLDSDSMRSGLRKLLTEAHGIQRGQLLIRIGELDLPTLGAVAVELSYLPELLRLARQFDRCAVISGRDWIRRLGEVEGAMLPGLEVKSFRPEREADALAWLAG